MPHIDIRSGPSYGTLDNMEQQRNDEEGDRLLHGESGYLSERNLDGDDSSVAEVQEGVRKIEAINMTWTSRTLVVAYIRFVHASLSVGMLVLTSKSKYLSHGVLYVSGKPNPHVIVGICDQCI